jgi:hypothetical protein
MRNHQSPEEDKQTMRQGPISRNRTLLPSAVVERGPVRRQLLLTRCPLDGPPTELLAVGEQLGDNSIGAPDAMGCWALELGGHEPCDARRRPSPESVKTCRGRSHPTWNVSTQLFTM